MLSSTLSRILCKKDASRKTLPYPHVELFHWYPKDGSINFGDHLSKIITHKIAYDCGLSFDDEVKAPSRMLGIGSILHFANTGDVVWGSGWNGKIDESEFKAHTLEVLSVRGPLTAEFLRNKNIEVPDVFGDPGLLVPALFSERFKPQPINDYAIVPNLHDISATDEYQNVISPLLGWNTVVEKIIQSKLVLASSLHGLIIAEAFGIPARYVRLSETENLFKYKDYYLGSGRTEQDFEYATSINEALEMGGAKPIKFNAEALINAFPYHLWNN